MNYIPSKKFDKQFAKLPGKIKVLCLERIKIFIKNPHDQILNNHMLSGDYKDFRSINVTGDIRIIYEMVDRDVAHFIEIGSHSELYK